MNSDDNNHADKLRIIRTTTEIVSAFVGNNSISQRDIGNFIEKVHVTIEKVCAGDTTSENAPVPAVPINKSVKADYIVCLEDGKKLSMLRRYLMTHYGLTPDQYRSKWNLPPTYPMVAPNYSKKRSEFARKSGLGRKPKN